MGGDDKLHISPHDKLPQQPQQLELLFGRQSILWFIHQVESSSPEAVLKESHVRLAMGFDKKRTVAEIFQATWVGRAPCIKDL